MIPPGADNLYGKVLVEGASELDFKFCFGREDGEHSRHVAVRREVNGQRLQL
jgi:hypothetical protein